MTKKEVMRKIRAMQKDVKNYVLAESERLLNSGAVEASLYENDYILPKIILTEVLSRVAEHYKPIGGKWIGKYAKDARNLKHF